MLPDLDRFKATNDNLGHEAGDQVLKEFARRPVASTRLTDTVARLAGDGFLVVYVAIQAPRHETQIAQKILRTMQSPLRVFEHSRELSASTGVAVRHAGEVDAETLLRRADVAM